MAGETDLHLAPNMAGAAASDDQVDVRLFGAGDLGGGTASRLEIADVETVEFTLKDGGSLGVPTLTQEDSLVDLVDTGATNALETLVVKGDNADVDLGSVTSMGTTFASVASNALSTVDLTDFSGETAIDITSNNSTEVLGSAQLDDIVGAAGGTVANLGAGGDRLDLTASSSLGVGSAVDTIVLEAGDSQAGGTGAFPNLNFDGFIGFEAGIDGFDLGAFGFSGQQTSALASLSTTEADALAGGFFGGSGPASDIADAFSSGGADRAVAIGTTSGIAGAQVAVVDVDENGDFDVATDLMFAVETISGASLTVGDFVF
jgi:hypothetical protein